LSDDNYGEEDDYGQEGNNGGHEQKQGEANGGGEGDDLINYKGIYFNDDTGQKYTCPETGAHFEFNDMCRRLNRIMQKRNA
jgi:hypothetical protein